ncbi:MAG TPA: hypothetical protein PKH07_02000, partial [bacterium]|nr:hypothetical protein [bacterium]
KAKTACMATGIIIVMFLRILESLQLHLPYNAVYLTIFSIITAVTFWSAIDYVWANAKHIRVT